MRVQAGEKMKFVSYSILTGLAEEKGLLNTTISEHDLRCNYKGNY